MDVIKIKSTFLGLCIWIIIDAQYSICLENGLAKTPPMGWISWERFTCELDCEKNPDNCINAKLYEDMALRLKEDGYLEVGYSYVNIDDCWSEMERSNETEELVPDTNRFPDGISGLSQRIHSIDARLKLGIYGDCGTGTCANFPAQLKPGAPLDDNYFELDAKTFAKWNVDSFKFDGCNIDPTIAESICPKFSKAVLSTERPILITCEWPYYLMQHDPNSIPDFPLAQEACNLWRYYEDVVDSWQSILNIVDFSIEKQASFMKYHGPGHWFDPDQLVIGNFGLSYDQSKAQMALWSIWSAPLFMSNDLREIDLEMSMLLKNRRVIAVDQDQMGVFGPMVAQTDNNTIQVFVKPVEPIKNGCPSFVILYLNRQTLGGGRWVSFNLRDILLKSPLDLAAERYMQLYPDNKPEGEFTYNNCLNKLRKAMTRDPNTIPKNLLIKSANRQEIVQLEDKKVIYKVIDLFGEDASSEVALDSTLTLHVKLSSVRMVKLVES